MVKEKSVERPAAIIPVEWRDLISILVVGAATGLLVWGLGLLFFRFVFDAYLCQGDIGSGCSQNAKNYSAILASLMSVAGALGGLIRLRVYRPLLVVIASMLSLWGVVQISWDFHWIVGMLVAVLLYAVAFGLYSWIARIREFWISLIVIIVLVVAVRIALLP